MFTIEMLRVWHKQRCLCRGACLFEMFVIWIALVRFSPSYYDNKTLHCAFIIRTVTCCTSGNLVWYKGPSTLATLFNHMWPRIVAGIFIPVGNHYFQALASTLQFVAQVCDRLWLVPATDRAFAYITYMSPPHVALVCSGPPQCAATCG